MEEQQFCNHIKMMVWDHIKISHDLVKRHGEQSSKQGYCRHNNTVRVRGEGGGQQSYAGLCKFHRHRKLFFS